MKEAKADLVIDKTVAQWLKSPRKGGNVNIYHSKKDALRTIQQFSEDSHFIVVPVAMGGMPAVLK